MRTATLQSAIKTGLLFGLFISLTLFAFGQLEEWLLQSGFSASWLEVACLSLLAGAIWGAFLTLNYRYPAVPGRFLYHLFAGVALAFSAALTAALLSYGWATLDPEFLRQLTLGAQEKWTTHSGSVAADPPAYRSAGNLALATYSFQFFTAFSLTLLLSTVSCIWECVAQEEGSAGKNDYRQDLV